MDDTIDEYQDRKGRRWIRCRGHPKATPKGFVLKKDLIFGEYIGRQLRKDETIVQVDYDNGNVALENLRIGWKGEGKTKFIRFEAIENNVERHARELTERVRWESLSPEERKREFDEALAKLEKFEIGKCRACAHYLPFR